MNTTVLLIFAIVAFIMFVISLRSLIRGKQEKKRQQEEQYTKDKEGDREEMM